MDKNHIKEHHRNLRELVTELLESDPKTPEIRQYRDVMCKVFNIINEGKQEELNNMLQAHFSKDLAIFYMHDN